MRILGSFLPKRGTVAERGSVGRGWFVLLPRERRGFLPRLLPLRSRRTDAAPRAAPPGPLQGRKREIMRMKKSMELCY